MMSSPKKNYFTKYDEILIHGNGLAMGAPIAGLISELLSTEFRTHLFSTPIKQEQAYQLPPLR